MEAAISGAFLNSLPPYTASFPAIRKNTGFHNSKFPVLSAKIRATRKVWSSRDFGELVQNGSVFRQSFRIRSYEIGADQNSTIETIVNHFQETSLNHARIAGVMCDGFGVTPEMSRRDLVWVVTKMHVQVEQYPSWGDVVEIDSWVSSAGKNAMRRDWDIRDPRTGTSITIATSTWVMINKHSRRLSRMTKEVRAEIEPLFFERDPILEHDGRTQMPIDDETSHHVRMGLTPEWTDIDCNQHVNNVKYIRWILHSIPTAIMEGHKLVGLCVEYLRECRKDGVVKSLTRVFTCATGHIECYHVLCLENGAELIRGRTTWLPN